ncbi:alpha/beta fold hydrolase [Ralstonia psammae]|uniref:alpha/beta fold hydrolase n=1 Tax=Ralstonia psammae TaxID=3058598 RepID=UPI00292D981C|nr:hypothetical protein [Ralstonia sp. LMG 19083]
MLPFNAILTSLGNRALFGRFTTKALHSLFQQAVGGVTPAVFCVRLRSVLDVDVTEELASVALPILYLQARADNVVPRSATALIQKIRPEMRLVETDSPHCLLQVVSQDAARVIGEFVVSTTYAMVAPIREPCR